MRRPDPDDPTVKLMMERYDASRKEQAEAALQEPLIVVYDLKSANTLLKAGTHKLVSAASYGHNNSSTIFILLNREFDDA